MNPLRPYFVRAVYEWCTDNGHTPYLMVTVNGDTQVPMDFVQNGEIIFNLSPKAVGDLQLGNDAVLFSARFSGVSHQIYIPIQAVTGIYAKETGQGMFFEHEASDPSDEANQEQSKQPAQKKNSSNIKKNHLKLIK